MKKRKKKKKKKKKARGGVVRGESKRNQKEAKEQNQNKTHFMTRTATRFHGGTISCDTGVKLKTSAN